MSTHSLNSDARASRRTGILMLVIASVFWSLSGVAVKTLHVDAIGFAFWRSLGAGLCMIALVPFSKGKAPPFRPMLLGVVLHAAVVTLLITSMTLSTAAAGIILQYTGPVFCALFAWMIQGRRIGPRTILALAIATIGVAIMLVGGLGGGGSAGGPIAGAISGVAFGALILTLESVNKRADGQPVNPFIVVMLNNLGTAALVLPIAMKFGRVSDESWKIAAVMGVGVIQLAVPYVLFVLALRRVSPVDASLLILLEPVLNPIWVWFAVHERPPISVFIGGAAILAAMVIDATKPTRATTSRGHLARGAHETTGKMPVGQ